MALEKIVPFYLYATIENAITFLKYELLKDGFTEIEPITTNYITAVQYNNLILEFKVSSNNIKIKITFILADGSTHPKSYEIDIATRSTSGDNAMDRIFYLYLVKSNNMLMLNFAKYNSFCGGGELTLLLNEVLFYYRHVATSSTATHSFALTDGVELKLLPKRTYAKAENTFFLDDVLPVVISENKNQFIVDLTDLVTLGGAKALNFYRMTNGDKYYCLDDNIAVKIDGQIMD